MARSDLSIDLLVVGAGPAGASLACFLARYGLKGIMISAAHGTADTPRAHITNMSALESMRDIGIEDECYKLGLQGAHTRHYRWCETMAEEEYGRIYAWGNDPKRKGDYETASPCPGVLDLPQTLLEPLLVKYATTHGFHVRFDTQLLSFTEDTGFNRIVSLVKDRLSGNEYRITSRYLFGADGGRSVIAKQLELPFHVIPGGGIAYNVHIRCDLSHLMPTREGNLHWNLRLKRDDRWMINMRMVKPWYEWLAIALPKTLETVEEPTAEQWKEWLRDLIGDRDAGIEILSTSKWNINEVCAEHFSESNVFCLGDAVHRHPPVNGLGSNTCIGDAFNLAWKVKLVMEGIANPFLLETYSYERQPVGAEVVRVSNSNLRKHMELWQKLGMQPPGKSLEERMATIKLLEEETERGRLARKDVQESILFFCHETHALGLEMGQTYSSSAVYLADEPGPWTPFGKEIEDPILYYEPSTYPGRRLPHVWLAQEVPTNLVSTHDLAGNGDFCIFTGPGGGSWKEAAVEVSRELNLPIKVVIIGARRQWRDVYYDWAQKRGVEEDGAVLVRPDLFCAWRSRRCLASVEMCKLKLEDVMKSILGVGKK